LSSVCCLFLHLPSPSVRCQGQVRAGCERSFYKNQLIKS
jgi:hypothetical protein